MPFLLFAFSMFLFPLCENHFSYGGLEVDGAGKVELLDNHTGTHVEVLADDGDELVGGLVGGAVRVDLVER